VSYNLPLKGVSRGMKTRNTAGQSEANIQQRWKAVIDFLHTVHQDYQQAKKQMEEVCSLFSGRENAVEQKLKDALEITLPSANQHEPSKGIAYLQVNCLGNFDVFVGYNRVKQWPSLKAKAVFKYLIAQRRHLVLKDMLMEALWQGCPPDVANSNLKTAIHSLRKTLGDVSQNRNGFTYIHFVDGHYLINPNMTLLIDDEDFERQWLKGQQLESEGDFSGAMTAYLSAEGLYKGDYLEEDLYEDWTLMRREALKDTYLNILIKLATHAAQAADYENCISFCQKILAKDPCCEEGYRHLMRSYSRLGQRNRAIQWYKVCDKTISTELGVKPEPLTISLFQRLVNDEAI
jgi:LuxR family maltose regulon positive regulatory protein